MFSERARVRFPCGLISHGGHRHTHWIGWIWDIAICAITINCNIQMYSRPEGVRPVFSCSYWPCVLMFHMTNRSIGAGVTSDASILGAFVCHICHMYSITGCKATHIWQIVRFPLRISLPVAHRIRVTDVPMCHKMHLIQIHSPFVCNTFINSYIWHINAVLAALSCRMELAWLIITSSSTTVETWI